MDAQSGYDSDGNVLQSASGDGQSRRRVPRRAAHCATRENCGRRRAVRQRFCRLGTSYPDGARSRREIASSSAKLRRAAQKPTFTSAHGPTRRAGPRRPPRSSATAILPPSSPHGRRARAGHASWRKALIFRVHHRAGARTHPNPRFRNRQDAAHSRSGLVGNVDERWATSRAAAAAVLQSGRVLRTQITPRSVDAARSRHHMQPSPTRRRARRGEHRRRARELRAHLFGRAARSAATPDGGRRRAGAPRLARARARDPPRAPARGAARRARPAARLLRARRGLHQQESQGGARRGAAARRAAAAAARRRC